MGLFSFTQEIAIDLGTANTVIIHNDKIVVDEPSVVALDKRTDKLLAVGEKARLMHGKTHENIRTIRPLRDGVIADFYAAEQMIRGMVKMVSSKSHWFSPSLRMVIGIPSGSTEVEIRAVRDSSEHAGGRDVYMIYEPMAAAIGIGLDVQAPEGNMIVDIGGGTTDVAVISLGGTVVSTSIKLAGDDFDDAIMRHVRKKHNLMIGERTAEDIKIQIGTVYSSPQPKSMEVKGRDTITGLPKSVTLTSEEIKEALRDATTQIMETIHSVLEKTPPELAADVAERGIVLTGGGALLGGLEELIEEETGINTIVADNPAQVVAIGTGQYMEMMSKMNGKL